jgi:hypothetical protein
MDTATGDPPTQSSRSRRKPHPLVAELACLRAAANLTVWEASRRAGLNHAVVRDWEAGEGAPSVISLEKYLAVFGLRIVLARNDTEALHRDAVRRLELEAIPQRPPRDRNGLTPITRAQAAENRRVLAEACGFRDDTTAREIPSPAGATPLSAAKQGPARRPAPAPATGGGPGSDRGAPRSRTHLRGAGSRAELTAT